MPYTRPKLDVKEPMLCSAGQFRDVDILEEAGAGEIFRAQQVPGRRD